MCPNRWSFLCFNPCSFVWILLYSSSLAIFSTLQILSIFLKHFISNARILLSKSLESVTLLSGVVWRARGGRPTILGGRKISSEKNKISCDIKFRRTYDFHLTKEPTWFVELLSRLCNPKYVLSHTLIYSKLRWRQIKTANNTSLQHTRYQIQPLCLSSYSRCDAMQTISKTHSVISLTRVTVHQHRSGRKIFNS